jgi:K+-sensing histidine kinase KdpD
MTEIPPGMQTRISKGVEWIADLARPGGFRGIVLALCTVVIVGALLAMVRRLFGDLPPVAITFLVPVYIAAIRWGVLAALVTTFAGVASSAFFFYAPIYSFHVDDPARVMSLALFVIVAVTTSLLAARTRRETELARQREIEIRDLYAFSRKLAAVRSVSDIFEGIQQHLSRLVARPVALFGPNGAAGVAEYCDADIPSQIRHAATALLAGGLTGEAVRVVDDGQHLWLVSSVVPHKSEFGVIAIDLGPRTDAPDPEMQARIEALLADAAVTLEWLGLSRALSDARMRTEAEQFRDALIGSVSHELRTPLASILGATTVLCSAPAVTGEPRLAALANIVREEADRLNNEIQNLLDATRISSEGLQPKLEWTEPADIVNAAVEHCRKQLVDHKVELELPHELVLLHVDAELVERALRLILDNAAKYSEPGSSIRISGRGEEENFVLSVVDEGVGLSHDDRVLLGQRFFRGSRHAGTKPGSGLGFWIAHSFIAVHGGRLEARSSGEGKGTTVRISLPLPAKATRKVASQ